MAAITAAEFWLLALFGPMAFLLIWAASAWLNGQTMAEWFRCHILRKRRR